jgi:hypothetical protein
VIQQAQIDQNPGWRSKSRGNHHTEWFAARYTTNLATGTIRATTNSYIELATDLNRPAPESEWVRSNPAFEITATGVEANGAGHRVRLLGNINSAGAVRIEKLGVILEGHPLCEKRREGVEKGSRRGRFLVL